MILVNLDGSIAADTTRYDVIGTRFPFSGLLSEAAVEDQGTALAVLEGEIYWVVVVPVKAPVPIAFIAAGIPVGTPLLDQFRSLSALPHSLALASVDDRGAWTLAAQSGAAMSRLPDIEDVPSGDAVGTVQDGERLAMTTRLDVAENSAPVFAILDYPLNQALGAYRAMLIPVLTVLALALAIALFGAMLIARGVSKPLEVLAEAAQRIAAGDYSSTPQIQRNDEIGELSRALKNMTDAIAERRAALLQAMESLGVARDEAVAANEAKSHFLSNMSHELRTPLNAILGFSEIIHKEVMGPVGQKQYAEYAGHIHESGEHLLAQLTAMLNLADGSAGKMSLSREEVTPASVLDSVSDSLRSVAAKAGVAIALAPAISSLPRIEADAPKLRMALANLVHNAIKFSPRGAMVEIGGEVAGDSVCLHITDYGIGIAAEEIPIITRPFHRRREAFDGTHQGAGIGLPLAKTIVELHGGRLRIESKPGDGTTIIVRLPLPSKDDARNVGDAA